MYIDKTNIEELNNSSTVAHERKLNFAKEEIPQSAAVIKKLIDFQVAIPSWALGTGGTRFARFSMGGEPRNLEEKIEDVGLLHRLNQSSGAISLHIPWDVPEHAATVKALAARFGV
jgi:L-rhamnose isomerase / sugar isomerase